MVTLFIIGGFGGWVLELFFRRYVSYGKWVNPGFLAGPFLPLYAFGLMTMYYLCTPDYTFGGAISAGWAYVVNILFIGVAMTLVELIAGLIFIKGMKIKLWDYSQRWGNFMGIICPLFSFIWMAIGVIYSLIHPFFVRLTDWVLFYSDGAYGSSVVYSVFVLGIFCGVLLLDCVYSFNIAAKITKAASGLAVNYDKLKESFRESHKSRSEKAPWILAFSKLGGNLQGYVDEYSRKAMTEAEKYSREVDIAKETKAMKKRLKSLERVTIRKRNSSQCH